MIVQIVDDMVVSLRDSEREVILDVAVVLTNHNSQGITHGEERVAGVEERGGVEKKFVDRVPLSYY